MAPEARGETASLPGWLASIADASPARGLVLGALVTVANPKELAIVLAAGVSVGGAALGVVQEVVVVLLFVGVAGLSVLVPSSRLSSPPTASRPGSTDSGSG
ncbi:GAP family protein [Oerskovia sp. M15]